MSSAPRAEPRPRRFAPGPALTLAWAAATVVLLGLGLWQLQRLASKSELIARAERQASAPALPPPAGPLEAAALDFARLEVHGSYLPGGAVALGLLTRDGRAGSRLLAPFRLEDGRLLLVDRGFVPEPLLAEALAAELPAGPRTLEGVARAGVAGRSWLAPEPDLALPRWYEADLAAIGRHRGLALEPLLLVLERPEPGGGPFPAPRPLPVDLPNPHLGYALTWLGLAGVLLVFYILMGRRRAQEERP
jgi:surfeit locus 1 family protein